MSDEQVNTSVEQAQTTPVPADVTTTPDAPVEATETTANTDAQQAAPETRAESADEGDEEARKRPSGSQRLKRQLTLIQTEAEALARENEELRRRTSAGEDPQGRPGVDRAPTEADFPNDYLAFERANNAWQVRQAVREEIGKDQTAKRNQVLNELRQERLEAYHDNVEQVRTRVPDFDKVVAEAKGVNISPALAEELLSSEKAALLQYHLAQNPDKVRELNGLSGRELARAIGRLEGRVHLPKPNTQTKAAPPPTQVGGGGATPSVNYANADMDQYVAIRQAELKKAGRA